jgi:hypothetical protein
MANYIIRLADRYGRALSRHADLDQAVERLGELVANERSGSWAITRTDAEGTRVFAFAACDSPGADDR